MSHYKIDWSVLADNMLLTAIRKPIVRAYAAVAMLPISLLYTELMAFRDDSLYKIQHNSQICYMEAVLNDKFDPNLRRIRIVNTLFKEPIYFYEPEENKEVFHYEPEDNKPVYYREPDEFAGEGFDFLVCVPPLLKPNNPQLETAYLIKMGAIVDYYKLYSKNYTILWQEVNL